MSIFSYIVNMAVSTLLVYLSIKIIDRTNYKNNLQNAFVTAVILSVAAGIPIFFFFSLFIWVYILINWYSIGLIRSFVCAFVYTALFFLLNVILALTMIGGSLPYSYRSDIKKMAKPLKRVGKSFEKMDIHMPEWVLDLFNFEKRKQTEEQVVKDDDAVAVVLVNGNMIKGRILEESEEGYVVDIAGGKAEVFLRRDEVDHIEGARKE